MDDKPRYIHDCDCCVFLGQYHGGHEADLYFCSGGIAPTVIARYSSDGPHYNSGLYVAEHYPDRFPDLAEAKRRAEQRGLLPTPKDT
jgi:hypothetical protein